MSVDPCGPDLRERPWPAGQAEAGSAERLGFGPAHPDAGLTRTSDAQTIVQAQQRRGSRATDAKKACLVRSGGAERQGRVANGGLSEPDRIRK
ncbi:hypothetical protein RSP03_19530 [Cereibacter sphaeroides]|nr:hypothetical protein RSP03_19530 [Cereibacter sphaeroides]